MKSQLISCVTKLGDFKSKAKNGTFSSIAVILMSEVIIKHLNFFELHDLKVVVKPWEIIVLFVQDQFELVEEFKFHSVVVLDVSNGGSVSGSALFRRDSVDRAGIGITRLVIIALGWKELLGVSS